MAKRAYAGISGAARRIRRGHTGVQATARRLRRGYIGVGGTARPCWSGGEIAYYGTVTPLSAAKTRVGAASNQQYAVFAGGNASAGDSATVDAYDAALTRTVPVSLPQNTNVPANVAFGEYALFAGGQNGRTCLTTVTAYDSFLSRTAPASISVACYGGCGAKNPRYAIVAGGYNDSARLNTANAFDSVFTRQNPAGLSVSRDSMWGGAMVGDYAVISGGNNTSGSNSSAVDAYDGDLVHVVAESLPVAAETSAAGIGAYAVVFCPAQSSGIYAVAYDKSLTRIVAALFPNLAGGGSASAAINEAAICFGGGTVWGGAVVNHAYSVDADLTCRQVENTGATGRYLLNAASVGDYALFGGGNPEKTDFSAYTNIVDVYTAA